jgi:protocatechuate 3,4-dioxygenase, beta subunit
MMGDSMDRPKSLTRRAVGAALLGGGLAALGSRGLAHQQPLGTTPESPMGPFYPVRKPADADANLVHVAGRRGRAAGQVIQVGGRLLDRRGNPISGGEIEVWQANAAGRYAHPLDISTAALDPNFEGYARLRTGRDGTWRITTIRPAAYSSPIGLRTPHIHFLATGRANRLIAQMYFPEDVATNASDALFKALGDEGPRSIARAEAAGRYNWDIILFEG